MPSDIQLDANGGEGIVLTGSDIALTGNDIALDAKVVSVAGLLRLTPTVQEGEGDPILPSDGQPGDLVMIVREKEGAMGMRFTSTTLWLCVTPPEPAAGGAIYWSQVKLEPPVVAA